MYSDKPDYYDGRENGYCAAINDVLSLIEKYKRLLDNGDFYYRISIEDLREEIIKLKSNN